MSHAYQDSVEDIWSCHPQGFAWIRYRLRALHQDVDAYHHHYQTAAGLLDVQREYLLIRGIRR